MLLQVAARDIRQLTDIGTEVECQVAAAGADRRRPGTSRSVTAVDAAAIVPMAVAGGRKDATAPAMSAPMACQVIMPVHVQAQDLALDRFVGVPDQAVLQRQ